jgi:hypothetical protein
MRIIDTAQVLARIQVFNNRSVDELVITAWHEILEPYELADCMRAVTEYFQKSKEWVMPVDIMHLVHEYRKARIDEFKNGLRLSDADDRAAAMAGTWPAAQRELYRLAGNGHITPALYDDYQAGKIQLAEIQSKELAR